MVATNTAGEAAHGQAVPARRLVTTAGERACLDSGEAARMLGPWCFTAEELLSGSVPAESVRFHWDDREKLARDYDYLQTLHARVLDAMVVTLNRFHCTAHSRRYWQILADPWLYSYLSALFDRWEALRLAFAGGEQFASLEVPAEDPAPPYCYTEFTTSAVTDAWNHWLLGRMTEFQYGSRCRVVRRLSQGTPDAAPPPAAQTVARRIARAVDRGLALLTRRNPVAFVQSYFRPGALLRLSVALRQVPRAYLHEFPPDDAPAFARPSRSEAGANTLRVDFAPANDFEKFVATRLPLDVPVVLAEEYAALAGRARGFALAPRVIVTATAQHGNPLAKAWFAERVAAGTALVVLEHGGSFPAPRELFDFEEDIADVRISWYTPYHRKHKQLPPSKLVGAVQRRANGGGPCLIIANESPPWIFRLHFYPMANQCLRSYRMTCDVVDALSEEVAQRVSIRPAPDQGWNLAKLFVGRFGRDRVSRSGTLESALAKARLIVCTYPETTFSEAMASDIPVVLVYPPEVYERHSVTAPLLEQLHRARIVFTDAAEAAAHISAHWADLDSWWRSADVVAARRAFRDTALRFDGDWIREWTRFLRSFMKPDNTETASR